MLSLFFRYFFTIVSSVYSYFKILNLKIRSDKLLLIITSFFISLSVSIFPMENFAMRIIFVLISYIIIICLFHKVHIYIAVTVSIISFSFSYISLTISSFVLSIITTPILNSSLTLLNPFFIICTGILQYALIYFLFQIKRLRNGMPFLYKQRIVNWGFLLGIFIFFYSIFLNSLPHSLYPINFLTLLFILFLAFLLLFWWRRRITLDYVQKLRMDEVESLYKKISDNEREIEKLNTNNDYLSKVIHKDNKLIPAMEMALHSYLLEAPSMEAEEARQFGADLLSQLQSMSAEREGIISNYQKNTDFHPKIGIYSVDAVILYMEKRAEKFNITYNLRFDNDIKDAIVGFIHERDMLHLLSDLIENAIIAVKDASHREIFLHIGFLQGGLFIDLYDSGIPFEPAVYQDFGTCQHTTHADSGGSGIGLMDIWNLKRKYKASLQIYEYLPDSDIYTKKIRLLFDRRNHFLLQTYRDKEIRSFITRSDLHVFPLKEMKKKDKE